MSPAPTDARREDYWGQVEASQTSIGDVLTDKIKADEWSPHALIEAGKDGSTLFVLAICSRKGDHMILREGYLVVDIDDDRPAPKWIKTHDRRVNGSLSQALIRGYARASNDELGGDNPDPLLLGATTEAVEDDPDELTTPIGDHPDKGRVGETVICSLTDREVPKSEAVNIGEALGIEKWVAKSLANGGAE